MSFNSANLKNVQTSLETSIKAKADELSAFAAMKLKTELVGSEHGTIPVQCTAALMGSSNDAKFAPGSDIPDGDTYIKYVQFDCERYGQKRSVDVLDAEELSARDILKMEDISAACARVGLSRLDRDLGTILRAGGTAAKFNLISTEALAAGKEFNNYDSATSNPMGSIQELVDDTLGGDTLFLGKDVANALRQHPQFTGDTGTARTAAGSMIPYEVFASQLMGIFGFSQVIIDGTYYSTNGAPQKLAAAQPLAGVCAVGHFDNLVLVKRKDIAPTVWESPESTSTNVAAWGSFTIVVGDSQLHKCFTNVLE